MSSRSQSSTQVTETSGQMKMGQDFPMVCEKCLGEQGFTRMMKLPMPAACKITGRPFSVFRWRARKGERFKETQVCYEIAAEKNICQCCLNDLDYNIPMALREAFENTVREMDTEGVVDHTGGPTSEVNQMFHFNQQLAKRDALGDSSEIAPAYKLLQMAKTFDQKHSEQPRAPKLPNLCVQWIKGACTRENCQFRPCCGAFVFPELHPALQEEEAKLKQVLRTRGPKNIPPLKPKVKEILLQAAKDTLLAQKEKSLQPPEDKTITTLYITNLPSQTANAQGIIRSEMEKFGPISKVILSKGKTNAFVTFATRIGAEAAMQNLKGTFLIEEQKTKVGWAGKRKAESQPSEPTPSNKVRKLGDEQEQEDTSISGQNENETIPSNLIKPAMSIPEYLPGIPLPAGFKPGEALPDPPAAMGKVKPLPKQSNATSSNMNTSMTWATFYPSLQPHALEGQVSLLH